jgi:hypothetical protein
MVAVAGMHGGANEAGSWVLVALDRPRRRARLAGQHDCTRPGSFTVDLLRWGA